jgi:hypothetical protein
MCAPLPGALFFDVIKPNRDFRRLAKYALLLPHQWGAKIICRTRPRQQLLV